MRNLYSALLATALLLCLAAPATAQRDMGTILGAVTDPSGAAIPGASITIVEESTGVTDLVESDAAGNYIRPLIKPGTYTVSAETAGFMQQAP